MKQIIILFVIVSAVSSAEAQKLKDNEVPAPVKEAFTKRFPAAKEVKWEKENDVSIEAEFKIGKTEYSAIFDQTGKWLETETEIKKNELPEVVLSAIAKEFSGLKIEEAEKSETPDQGMLYEVKLEKKEITYAVQFSSTGKVLKKEEGKESEEEKDND